MFEGTYLCNQGTLYCVIPLHHPPHSAGTESNRGLRLPKQICVMLIVPFYLFSVIIISQIYYRVKFFGSPAQIRTEFLAFRGLPVLETGVLTITLRGSIVYQLPSISLFRLSQDSSIIASSVVLSGVSFNTLVISFASPLYPSMMKS